MNEEALKDSYDSAVSNGYTGSPEEYVELLNTNEEALNDSHMLFTKGGYTGSVDDFSELLGLKKKDPSGLEEDLQSYIDTYGPDFHPFQVFASTDAKGQTPEDRSSSRLNRSASGSSTQEEVDAFLKGRDQGAVLGYNEDGTPETTSSPAEITEAASAQNRLDTQGVEDYLKTFPSSISEAMMRQDLASLTASAKQRQQFYDNKGNDDVSVFNLGESDYGGGGNVEVLNGDSYAQGYHPDQRKFDGAYSTGYSFGPETEKVGNLLKQTISNRDQIYSGIQTSVLENEEFKKSVREDKNLLEQYTGKFSALPREILEKTNDEITEYLSRFNLELDDFMFDTKEEAQDFGGRVSSALSDNGFKETVWVDEPTEEMRNAYRLVRRLATEDAAIVDDEIRAYLERFSNDNTASMSFYPRANTGKSLSAVESPSDLFNDPRLAGKINRGSFSYRLEEQSGYEINDQLLEEKARTLFNNLFNQSYQAEGKDVLKSFVSENIPENLKGDKEAINAIDDLLFNSMGLTLDVSGDAVYNDKPVHVQLKQALARGAKRTFADPVENILMSIAGVDKQDRAEYFNEAQLELLKGATVIDKSIKDSINQGDYRMAFTQGGVGVAENLPQLGLAALTGGRGKAVKAGIMGKVRNVAIQASGPGILGYSSYLGASNMAYTDPRFSHLSDNQKNGYAMRTGFRDGAAQFLMQLAISGTGIQGKFSRKTQGLMTRAYNQGRLQFVRDFTIGAGTKIGVATSSDAIGEAVIETSNYIDEVNVTGSEFSPDELYRRQEMAFTSGGVMTGVGATGRVLRSTSLNSANYASERAFFYEKALQSAEISEIDKKIKKQEEDKKMSSQEELELRKRREDLSNQRDEEFESMVFDRERFFEMMKRRFPEQSSRLEQLNMEVNEYLAKSASPDVTDESKKTYKDQINSRLKEIQKIKNLYSKESLDLTPKESSQSLKDRIFDQVNRVNENIDIDRSQLEAVNSMIADVESIDEDFAPDVDLQSLKNKASEIEERIGEQSLSLKSLQESVANLSQVQDGTDSEINDVIKEARNSVLEYMTVESLDTISKPDTTVDEETGETIEEDVEENIADLTDVDPDVDTVEEVTPVIPEAKEGEVVVLGKKGRVVEGQVPSMTSERAEVTNSMFEVAKILGVNQLVILSKAEADAIGMGPAKIVGDVIYVSPESSDTTNNEENEAAKAKGIPLNIKTYESHLLEEVMHAGVTKKWAESGRETQIDILNRAMDLIKDPVFESIKARAILKASQYSKDKGFSDALVYNEDTNSFSVSESLNNKEYDDLVSMLTEEAAFEPLLAYAEAVVNNDQEKLSNFTPQQTKGFKDFIRYILEKLGLAKANIDLSSDRALSDMMYAFAQGRKGNAAKFKNQKASSVKRNSDNISPYSLPEEGKITVEFNKTQYKYYRDRHKKDIGNYPSEKTFNGKWHFINWWKKSTDFGKNSDNFGFKFEGKPIDVDALSRLKTRESKGINLRGYTPKMKALRHSIYGAEKAGIVSEIVRKKLISKTYSAENMASRSTRSSEDGLTPDSRNFKILSDLTNNVNSFLDKESKRAGIPLPNNRDSSTLMPTLEEYASGNIVDDLKKFKEQKGLYLCKDGSNSCYASSNISNRQFVQMLFEDFMSSKHPDFRSMDASQKAVAGGEVYGKLAKFQANSQDWLNEHFGGSSPVNFYDNTASAIEDLSMSMIMQGRIGKDSKALRDSNKLLMSLLLATTSQVNTADKNVTGASQLLYNSLVDVDFRSRYRMPEGADPQNLQLRELVAEIIPNQLIEDIRKTGVEEQGFDYVNGMVKEQVANNLDKINRLFNGESVVGASGVEHNFNDIEKAVFAQQGGGLLISNEVFDLMNTQLEGGTYVAQDVLGEKIGAFFLNLMGNKNVVTIDSHVVKLSGMITGEYSDYQTATDAFFQRNKDGSINADAMRAIQITGLDIETSSHQEVLDALVKKSEKATKGSDEKKEIANMVNRMVNYQPSAPKIGSDKRANIESFVETVAKEMNVDPADAMQFMFADDQVFNNGKSINGRLGEYTPFMDEINRVIESRDFTRSTDRTRETRLREAYNEALIESVKNSSSQEVKELHSRSLISAIEEKQIESVSVGLRAQEGDMKADAVESRLYGERPQPKEGVVSVFRNATMGVNADVVDRFLDFGDYTGYLVNVQGESTVVDASEASFDGVKVVFNPFRANAFTDVEGRPIKSVEDLTFFNGVGYARGTIEYLDHKDPSLISDKQKITPSMDTDPNYMDEVVRTIQAVGEVNGVPIKNARSVAADMSNAQRDKLMNSPEARNSGQILFSRNSDNVLRQFAKKAAENVSGATRAKILKDPENYITPMKFKEIKKDLKTYTDEELVYEVQRDQLQEIAKSQENIGVLAGAEVIRRAIEKGNTAALPDLIRDLAAVGTTAGRLLRAFGEMKKSTPEGMLSIFKSKVEERGNTLSKPAEEKLLNIVKQLYRQKEIYNKAAEKAVNTGQDEGEVKKAYEGLQKIKKDLSTLANTTIERGYGDILTMMVQGNLFTPLTHMKNVGGNIINILGFQIYDPIAFPIEKAMNAMGIPSKVDRSFSLNAYFQAYQSMIKSFPKTTLEQVKGYDPEAESEWTLERNLFPLRSAIALFSNRQDLPLNSKGRKSINQQLKLALQSMPQSVSADINFRALTVGDVPFRSFGEVAFLHQVAKKRGLKGNAKKMFLKYPPKKVLEQAQQQGAMLTFQKPSSASQFAMNTVNDFQKNIGGALNKMPGFGRGRLLDGEQFVKFATRAALLPFVATPTNIINETLTFLVPPYAIMRMSKAMSQGDAKEASQHAAKAMVGLTMISGALVLIKEGLFSGPVGFQTGEDEKKRNIRRMTTGVNSVNVSGLNRYLNGEDHSYREGDVIRNVEALGILGTSLTGVALSVNEEELEGRSFDITEPAEAITRVLGLDASGVPTAMLKQSFLQGADGLLKVLATEDETAQDKYLARFVAGMFRAGSSAALPNWLGTISRYTNPYLPDRTFDPDKSWTQQAKDQISFTLKERMFMSENLPVALDWRGREVKTTPEGADPLTYHFFDVTRAREGTSDPVANEAQRLFDETGQLLDVVGFNQIAKNRKQQIPAYPREGKKKTAIANYNSERAKEGLAPITFFNDPKFVKSVRFNQEQILDIKKSNYVDRYDYVSEAMSSDNYKKMNDLEKVSYINSLNKLFNSAIELEGDIIIVDNEPKTMQGFNLRPYSKKVLNAYQEIYDKQKETYVEF
mgnify:FL=1